MDKEGWGNQGIHGKEIWRRKWKQPASNTFGKRWRQQLKIELDGEEWSVAYAQQRVSKLKKTNMLSIDNN